MEDEDEERDELHAETEKEKRGSKNDDGVMEKKTREKKKMWKERRSEWATRRVERRGKEIKGGKKKRYKDVGREDLGSSEDIQLFA